MNDFIIKGRENERVEREGEEGEAKKKESK